jgi:hypothetical protein
LLQQGADKEEELQALLKIPPAIQWEKDLELFLEAWEVSYPLIFKPLANKLIAVRPLIANG